MSDHKFLVFVCTRTQTISEKRLSHRIAKYLEDNGVGEIGQIQNLGEQLTLAAGERRKMIFLNDCNSSCVKLLTNGFQSYEFVYMDVSGHKGNKDFEIEEFCKAQILPSLKKISFAHRVSMADNSASRDQY